MKRKRASYGLLLGITGALVFLLVAVVFSTAFAHAPHDALFASNIDSCIACHRPHTAPQAKLLKGSFQYHLCMSCHDGTGADTNIDGTLRIPLP